MAWKRGKSIHETPEEDKDGKGIKKALDIEYCMSIISTHPSKRLDRKRINEPAGHLSL